MELKNLDKAHELKEMLDSVDRSLERIESIYSPNEGESPLDDTFDLTDYNSQQHLYLSNAGVAGEVIDGIKAILNKQRDKIIKQVEKL